MNLEKAIAIVGPTASGKSKLAHELAKRVDGEIISCDSVQIYKGFDIGSAKATEEEQKEIPYHLIDCAKAEESFDAARYRKNALKIIKKVYERKKTPIIVGGTGLYFRALCGAQFHDLPSQTALKEKLEKNSTEELYKALQSKDPERAKALHPNDRFRILRACEICILSDKTHAELTKGKNIQPTPFTILCNPPREKLLKIIEERSRKMLEQGLLEEVEDLLAKGCPMTTKPMQTIGYLQICQYKQGLLLKEQVLEKIIIATRQYARKQSIWFRKVPIDFEIQDPYDLSRIVEVDKAWKEKLSRNS